MCYSYGWLRIKSSVLKNRNRKWSMAERGYSGALDEAINIRKLDVVALEIDGNASNKKKIESYKRVNGPPEYVEETVKGLNDVFHAAKSMGRQAIKIVTLFVEQVKSKIKSLIVTLPPDVDLMETILTPLLPGLAVNFDSYFIDIREKFVNVGATEWIDANRSISSMQDFAKSMKQVDTTIDFQYWTPIVEVYNEMNCPFGSFFFGWITPGYPKFWQNSGFSNPELFLARQVSLECVLIHRKRKRSISHNYFAVF